MATPREVIVRGGGGGAAGVLLIILAIAGLLALFSGKLDELINSIGGGAGAEGLTAPSSGTAGVVDRSPQPAGGRSAGSSWGSGDSGAPVEVARRAGFRRQ